MWSPSPVALNHLRIAEVKALVAQQEDSRTGRRIKRDRAIVTFDLDAGARSPFPPARDGLAGHDAARTTRPHCAARSPQTSRASSTGTSSSCLSL